jgi:tetratricopeptide (TPR) repeat protein
MVFNLRGIRDWWAREMFAPVRGLVILIVALVVVGNPAVSRAAEDDANSAIQQLYSEAEAAESAGQLQQAIEKYQQILKLAPNLPAAHNNLGQIYYQQGRFDEAIPELRTTSKLNPKLAPPRALLGFAYYQMQQYEQARDQLEIAAKLNPADRNVKLFLARSLVNLGDLRQAERLLEELQKEDPKNVEVLYTLGGVYSNLAESALGEIQAVAPNSYLLEVLLAKVAAAKSLYADAAEHYKRAIERAPQTAELYYQYGHALWAGGKGDEALEAYKHALQLNPYDSRASWEAGRVMLAQDPAEAIRLVSEALKLQPDIPEAWKVRGQAFLALHKPQEAVNDLKKSVELDPEDSTTHFELARAYRQAGMLSAAQQEDAIFQKMQEGAQSAGSSH